MIRSQSWDLSTSTPIGTRDHDLLVDDLEHSSGDGQESGSATLTFSEARKLSRQRSNTSGSPRPAHFSGAALRVVKSADSKKRAKKKMSAMGGEESDGKEKEPGSNDSPLSQLSPSSSFPEESEGKAPVMDLPAISARMDAAPSSELFRETTITGDDDFRLERIREAALRPSQPRRSRLSSSDVLMGLGSQLETASGGGGHKYDGDEKEAEFKRIWIQSDTLGPHKEAKEVKLVCKNLQLACLLRDKWVYKTPSGEMPLGLVKSDDMVLDVAKAKSRRIIPPADDRYVLEFKDGVFVVRIKPEFVTISDIVACDSHSPELGPATPRTKARRKKKRRGPKETPFQPFTYNEFVRDLNFVMKDLVMFGPAKTFCYQRLQILKAKFKLHVLLNEESEMVEVRRVPHRDIYNVRKVDNHVHHSACMTQKHLLRFIKSRLEHVGDIPVLIRPGEKAPVTLKHIFREMDLTAYDLSIDALDMAAGDTFHRFDRFNMKYNPLGQSSLRQVFLKYDNFTKGRFLADISKEVFGNLEDDRYSYAEYRLSIYGKSPLEWSKLADWVCDFDLKSLSIRWMIQIPRLYAIYKKRGLISNFGKMIDNIFRPLFEVTLDPMSNPKLHLFLTLVVGFDTVDDESIRERKATIATPSDWDFDDNPPYLMWCYYIYANLFVLNKVREKRGLNGFAFRPHAGEAGDIDHVASTFLLCEGINHGLTLKKTPVLQYLYFLKQVGISMSPLSNNLLFVAYDRNPFPAFFERGLNVTLSTDDPLLIHFTRSALVEEYAIASQVYKLSPVDVCEIARNSVLQCGFPLSDKKHWIGRKFYLRGAAGNQIKQTNVPDIRLKFRDETLREEEALIMGLPLQQFPAGFSADYKVVRTRASKKRGVKRPQPVRNLSRRASLVSSAYAAMNPRDHISQTTSFGTSFKELYKDISMQPMSSPDTPGTKVRKPSLLHKAMVAETGDMDNSTLISLPVTEEMSLLPRVSEDHEMDDSKELTSEVSFPLPQKQLFKVKQSEDGEISLSINFRQMFASQTFWTMTAIAVGYGIAKMDTRPGIGAVSHWFSRFWTTKESKP